MVKRLEEAVEEIEKLPDDVQDAIAARLQADLADETAWAARLAVTGEAQWARIADLVREELGAEDPTPFEDVFPASCS